MASFGNRTCAPIAIAVAILVGGAFLLGRPETGFARQQPLREAVVKVPVATVWTEPSSPRAADHPALSPNPNTYSMWVRRLAIDDRLAMVGRIQTQALMGERARVIASKRGWSKILLPDQPLHANRNLADRSQIPRLRLRNDSYAGWVPTAQLALPSNRQRRNLARLKHEVVVVRPTAKINIDLRSRKRETMQVSFDTRLPLISRDRRTIGVLLPNGSQGTVRQSDVTIGRKGQPHRKPSGRELVKTASQFRGLKYLWGGNSGLGFDCSGYIYRLFHANGITIPRDSGPQWKTGRQISRHQLAPGDVVFFARNNRPPHHVGLYIGKGKMIHAPNSRSEVRIDSISLSPYRETYLGARRYL